MDVGVEGPPGPVAGPAASGASTCPRSLVAAHNTSCCCWGRARMACTIAEASPEPAEHEKRRRQALPPQRRGGRGEMLMEILRCQAQAAFSQGKTLVLGSCFQEGFSQSVRSFGCSLYYALLSCASQKHLTYIGDYGASSRRFCLAVHSFTSAHV